MGRYTKKYRDSLRNRQLHDSTPTSIALKTCPKCHKIAIIEDELQLFTKAGYCLQCTVEMDKLINPLRQGSPNDKRTPVAVPRTGVCCICGKQSEDRAIGYHHFKYPDNKYSLELCSRCHTIHDAQRRNQDRQIQMMRDGCTIFGEDWSIIEDREAYINNMEDVWIAYYIYLREHPHAPLPKTDLPNMDEVFA